MPKKHLSEEQEFEILKLVLDKFLWLGLAIMAFGFYKMISASADLWYGLIILLSGSILMLVFMLMLVREFNYRK